jgi:hypothetical protein
VEENDVSKTNEVIALKGDHILVDEDGKTRPYRGESFSELGIKIGGNVTLLTRFGDNVKDYIIVAKREQEYLKALTEHAAAHVIGATILAVLAGCAAIIVSEAPAALLKSITNLTRHLF